MFIKFSPTSVECVHVGRSRALKTIDFAKIRLKKNPTTKNQPNWCSDHVCLLLTYSTGQILIFFLKSVLKYSPLFYLLLFFHNKFLFGQHHMASRYHLVVSIFIIISSFPKKLEARTSPVPMDRGTGMLGVF